MYYNIKNCSTNINYKLIQVNPAHTSLVLSHISPQRPLTLKIYQNSIIFHDPYKIKTHGEPPQRTIFDINNFSKQSRLRMLKLLSRINLNNYQTILFQSLTFHNIIPANNLQLKRFLDNYLKRLKRNKFFSSYVWRLEFQKRGAPHFHLFIFSRFQLTKKNINSLKKKLSKAWLEIINDNSFFTQRYSVLTQEIDKKSNIFRYISKYTNKEEENNFKNFPGRRWGYSRNLDISHLEDLKIFSQNSNSFREKLLNWIKQKIKISEEFENAILNSPSFTILSSPEQIKEIKELFMKSFPNDKIFKDLDFYNFFP